jgi:hypothetical protein
MLSTAFKMKLPKGLAYPIGAKDLSESLCKAPHLDETRLTFYCHVARTNKIIRDNLPLCILHAKYNPFISIVSKSHWELTVGAIPSELCDDCRRLLVVNGLPFVVEWLQSSLAHDWEPTRARTLKLMFHPSNQELSIIREIRP